MDNKLKYKKYDRNQLIDEITQLKKNKGLGITWEESREIVVDELQENLPFLVNDFNKNIEGNENNINSIIEGENLHSLAILNQTHRKKIDLIYIDPPYNTGAESWKYNNKFINKDDAFKHSKWLQFMKNRLILAKDLLKDAGIIVVTIDNYEFGPLTLLMDEIFRETNRLNILSIVHNPRGRSDDKFFATSHEYALIYGKNINFSFTNKLKLTEEQKEDYPEEDEESRYRLIPFQRSGSNSTPKERPNLYYPLYINKKTNEVSLSLRKKNNLWIEVYPKDSKNKKRVWRWGKETLLERMTEIHISFSKNKYKIDVKDRIKEGRIAKTVWKDPKYDASSHGTNRIKKILGDNKFDYPKSIYAVKDIVDICTRHNKKALILDFFAGSGTTGHAVLELNKDDNGERKFILCTNNENNVCTEICYPYIKKVLKNFPRIGLNYYKINHTDFNNLDKTKQIIFNYYIETVLFKENIYKKVENKKNFIVCENISKILIIVKNQLFIDEIKKYLNNKNKETIIYIFSLAEDNFSEEFGDFNVKVFSFPTSLINNHRVIINNICN